MTFYRFEFINLENEGGIFINGDNGRSIVFIVQVQHLDIDRRFTIKILLALDQLGLACIGSTQIQPSCHLQHRCFRTEYDDFVIDGVHRDGNTAVGDAFQG